MHLVSFITVLQIECALVEMIKATWACTWLWRWIGVPLYRTGCEIGGLPCTIMGPKPSGRASLNLQMGVVNSIGSGGDLGQLRRSYVRLFTATATLHLRCNADNIVLCPCTRPPSSGFPVRQLQLFLI